MITPYYDVVVIGGGIQGVGVAQAAAAAGYSVLLLEQSAIGGATSSKSSKLIHGGLRYLESGQFALVRECLKERAILLRNAPELVKLVPFYIPIYANTTRRPWKIHTGLTLYKLLSGLDVASGFHKLAPGEWLALDGLKQQDLQAVFQYHDAQTDDAALTKAVAYSAQSLGAEIYLPAKFLKAEIRDDACVVYASHDNDEQQYRCGVLVNAAGPWLNQVLSQCIPSQNRIGIDLVQGSHIVVNETGKGGVFYLEAPDDHRAVFVMPWRSYCLVGTTETLITESVEKVAPLPEEIKYLLDTFNHYFPASVKTHDDIMQAFAGVRVLPRSPSTLFRRNRDVQFVVNTDDKPRLISLVGGKLTAYRSTAEKVVARIAGSLPQRKRRAETDKLGLHPAK